MEYFFPSALTLKDLINQPDNLPYTVNSGENAIRLLLRSLYLKKRSKIAVPMHVCDSLKNAILLEGFEPFYLDLKNDGSFWTEYNIEIFKSSKIDTIILVHLYGFIHPDIDIIMNYCQASKTNLIHDAAQCYGINEDKFQYSSGIIYSFGPGKSSTAAGGAIVKGLKENFYKSQTIISKKNSIQDIHSKLFFRSRVYEYSFSLTENIIKLIFSRLKPNKNINTMSPFQKKAANAVMRKLEQTKEKRVENYNFLLKEISAHTHIQIAYNDPDGLFFKLIISIKKGPEDFKEYLKRNYIPYFCLFDSLAVHKEKFEQYEIFKKNSPGLIELSTEASIPFEEIERIVRIIKAYTP